MNEKLRNLKSAIKLVVNSTKSRLDFKNIGYLPRWTILSIDVSICLIAAVSSYLVINNLEFNFDSILNIKQKLAFLLITNFLFFILFRTYAGLIRHSTFIDAIKLLFSSISTLIVLNIVNYIFFITNDEKLYAPSTLIIYFLISYCFLFLFRVFVKQTFELYFSYSNNEFQYKALIFGSDFNAISIANALKNDKDNKFQVVGFIDKRQKNASKQILGLPIVYLKKNVSVILRANNADVLIIADKTLSKKEKIDLVDDCLQNDFKVYSAPLISDLGSKSIDFSKQIKNIQIEDLLERKPIVLDNLKITEQLKQKVILVTGAAGSIGSEIVRQVAQYDPKLLIVLDQAETPLHQIQNELLSNYSRLKFETVVADVRNSDRINDLFTKYKPEVVYHAAAYKHVPLMEENPTEAIFVNVMGTMQLADIALKNQVEKFVMVSTDKAVNPSNIMGASKRIAEMYVQALHYDARTNHRQTTSFITTRFGNVLGSNGSVVPIFKKQIEKGGPITITHPDIIRYFMTIPEACQLVLEAGAMGKGGEIFIFDMGDAVRIMDLATKMIQLAGFTPHKDIKIKIVGLRPGEKLYEELLTNKSTTLQTYNDKIMIAKETTGNYHFVKESILDIILLATKFEHKEMVIKMKDLVPEFKSLNSDFAELDKEEEDSKFTF